MDKAVFISSPPTLQLVPWVTEFPRSYFIVQTFQFKDSSQSLSLKGVGVYTKMSLNALNQKWLSMNLQLSYLQPKRPFLALMVQPTYPVNTASNKLRITSLFHITIVKMNNWVVLHFFWVVYFRVLRYNTKFSVTKAWRSWGPLIFW